MKRSKRPPAWGLSIALLAGLAGLSVLVFQTEGLPWALRPTLNPSSLERTGRLVTQPVNAAPAQSDRVHDEILLNASRTPLAAAVYYAAALQLDEAADSDKILGLLDHAIRLNPRHRLARTWRARMYFLTGRPELAVEELATLLRADPRRSDYYTDALVDLALTPGSHKALLELLSQSPRWAGAFAEGVSEAVDDDDFLTSMAQRSTIAFDVYVNKLAARGDLERAFYVWQSRLSEQERLQFSWPFDPRFDRADEAGVFGWRIAPALAQRIGSGLQVFYSGIGEPEMARQTLLLGAGYDYRLGVTATAQIEDQGGRFGLLLQCLPGGARLGEISLSTSIDEPDFRQTTFSVPRENCLQQSLRLVGQRGDKPLRARAVLHDVSIQEIGPTPAVQEAATAGDDSPSRAKTQ